MPRGRKRKVSEFVPRPWIPNSSSEDEYHDGPRDEQFQIGMQCFINYYYYYFSFIFKKIKDTYIAIILISF